MIRRFAWILFLAWSACCIYGDLSLYQPNYTRLFVLVAGPLLIVRVLRWGWAGRSRRGRMRIMREREY